ncbi:ferredoxin [Nisaea acidiphila]|uniref:Ferredoxin n=1 Tax=Nisaea acidiphila TaxID=1862145 RepID=A0A9J7AM86_9PROT|nr:ferredoxin [Nisaea acidiphila]UUX48755.1 ferredoxin [Nisaea acidiphila]
MLESGELVETVLLVGHSGSRIWASFTAAGTAGPDPLDAWSRTSIRRVAEEYGGHVVMPSDGPPYWPFQRWAMRAEPVFPSPLGILIHPEFGLWHGYRGALLFERRLDLPEPVSARSPCETCVDRPCLHTCPVGAFGDRGYDVMSCRAHLRSGEGAECLTGSCLARRACPVGVEYRYESDHAAFHMAAFLDGLPG